MKGFLRALRLVAGTGRELVLALLAGLLLATVATAEPTADPSAPGAYCEIGQCRPVSATGWTPAAFALTVLAIGRSARRGAERR